MNRNLRRRLWLCAALFTLLLGAGPRANSAQSAAVQNADADAPARNFIWRVSRGRTSMYLAGSIHTLNPDNYPLPEVMESAFRNSYA
ncbi:MAG TPA: TraB/GumN family protein, partial [Gammaproteobacteria bacterium]|nr:TraB/GumN family protein [Gammaproteobacteria bacterium]